jgi:lysophospholipase L1-like esterase
MVSTSLLSPNQYGVATTNGFIPGSATGLSDGVATTTTDRTRFTCPTGATITNISCAFVNAFAIFDDLGEHLNPDPITITGASIEYPAKSNTMYPVTFAGNVSTTLPGNFNGVVYNDPCPIMVTGDWDIRIQVTVASGKKWPTMWGAITSNFGESAGVNLSQLTGAVTVTAGFMYSPVNVLGTFINGPSQRVAVLGDSINCGLGDSTVTAGFYGPIARIMNGQYGCTKLAKSSESIAGFQTFSQSYIRRLLLQNGNHTHVFENYGTNDLIAGRSAAAIIADLTNLYTWLTSLGLKIIPATIPPRTTSSNNFISPSDQTVQGAAGQFTTQRNILNAWKRSLVATPGAFNVIGLLDYDYLFCGNGPAYSDVWDGNGLNQKINTNDGTHPNGVGNIKMWNSLGPAALALLNK